MGDGLSRAAAKKGESGLLPKVNRIRKGSEIKRILRNGRFHFSSTLFRMFADLSQGAGIRVAVVCSKKVGGAVDRNCTRRAIHRLVLKYWHKLAKNFDVVVVPKMALRGSVACDEEFRKGFEAIGCN